MGRQITIAVVSALVTAAVLWAVARAGGFIEQIFIPELPGGAVVAFDGSCPTGWQPYEAGAGKFLLGAGTGTLRYRGPHQPENAPTEVSLTSVEHGDQGGVEQHTLTVEEMPKHSHGPGGSEKSRLLTLIEKSNHRLPKNISEGYGWDNPPDTASAGGPKGATRGEASPHNNMPPYIALYFCKKKG